MSSLSHNACALMQPNNSERLKRQFIGIPSGIHLGTTQSWIKSQLPTINYNCYKKTIKYNCKEIFVPLLIESDPI